jgi:hypothetical protein
MENKKVEVGQTLYEPNRRTGSYREYKVVSIGRKWISLSGGARCTIDGLKLDCGGYGARRLYINTEAYEAARKLESAWSDLLRDFQFARIPEGMTVDAINAIRHQFGLKVFGDPE